jgi:hypothetical protein
MNKIKLSGNKETHTRDWLECIEKYRMVGIWINILICRSRSSDLRNYLKIFYHLLTCGSKQIGMHILFMTNGIMNFSYGKVVGCKHANPLWSQVLDGFIVKKRKSPFFTINISPEFDFDYPTPNLEIFTHLRATPTVWQTNLASI